MRFVNVKTNYLLMRNSQRVRCGHKMDQTPAGYKHSAQYWSFQILWGLIEMVKAIKIVR